MYIVNIYNKHMISDMESYRYETSVKTLVKESPFLVKL